MDPKKLFTRLASLIGILKLGTKRLPFGADFLADDAF
jgi:hypothetical protein